MDDRSHIPERTWAERWHLARIVGFGLLIVAIGTAVDLWFIYHPIVPLVCAREYGRAATFADTARVDRLRYDNGHGTSYCYAARTALEVGRRLRGRRPEGVRSAILELASRDSGVTGVIASLEAYGLRCTHHDSQTTCSGAVRTAFTRRKWQLALQADGTRLIDVHAARLD